MPLGAGLVNRFGFFAFEGALVEALSERSLSGVAWRLSPIQFALRFIEQGLRDGLGIFAKLM